MLVHEAGDELHLLSAVPDWWLGEGEEIRVERAPTHFDEMSLTVRGTSRGVKIDLSPPKRSPPRRIVLHLPASRPLVGELDGVEVELRSEQTKRWDFPTVVEHYLQTSRSFKFSNPVEGENGRTYPPRGGASIPLPAPAEAAFF